MSRWQEFAACADEDPELFFPVTKWQEKEAKRICAGCPVKIQCGQFAQTSNRGGRETFGVWAGRNVEKKRELGPGSDWRTMVCLVCATKWRWKRLAGGYAPPKTCSARCRRVHQSRTQVAVAKLKETG